MRLAIIRDYLAEGWPSMDLCADQLLAHLPDDVHAHDIAPSFKRMFSKLPVARHAGFNADRLLNRHLLLPRTVRRLANRTGFIHIVDHSYAHLVNSAPEGRAGVYCHDLDAFRSILEPEKEPRPWWFRRLAQRTLEGLRHAAVIFHSTASVAEQILRHRIISSEKLVYAPYGVASEFRSESGIEVQLPFTLQSPYLLHVGNNIPRKRIDVLLKVFASVQKQIPELRLIQIGGPWPTHLKELIDQLGIDPFVTQFRGLTRLQLAELYRRAEAVLVTSDAEGFGLPVIEALACGSAVVASDLPVLREVGGDAVDFCSVADIPSWIETVLQVVRSNVSSSRRSERIAHASRFTWREHARIISDTYKRLAAGRQLK